MSNYESIYQALKAQFTDEEIAEGYLIPADLTPDQAKESAESFRKIRLAALENRTAEDSVIAELAKLRIALNHYLETDTYSPAFSFGQVLKAYAAIKQLDDKALAEALDTDLSTFRAMAEEEILPSADRLRRLAEHSDAVIPATYWWKLICAKQDYLLCSD